MDIFVRLRLCSIHFESVVPDKIGEEVNRCADEPGGARLLSLGTGQCQPVVHVTLAMQNGLPKNPGQSFPTAAYYNELLTCTQMSITMLDRKLKQHLSLQPIHFQTIEDHIWAFFL